VLKAENLLFSVNLIQGDYEPSGVRTAVAGPERSQSFEEIALVTARAVSIAAIGSKNDNRQYRRSSQHGFSRGFHWIRLALDAPNASLAPLDNLKT